MNVVAPLPKKPSSSSNGYNWLDHHYYDSQNIDMQDACLELQQILLCSASSSCYDSYITRTGNPLVQDSSFIPLHQAVSQLSVASPSPTQQRQEQEVLSRRPRSYSVGDRRNNYFIVQPIPCKPVY